LTVFGAVLLATMTATQVISAMQLTGGNMPPGMSVNLKGVAGKMGMWAFVGYGVIMVWGSLLCRFAPMLADAVCRDLGERRESSGGA
jgi:hypothetical protein